MEVSPRSRIEPGGRLVEEEEGGATNDGHGDIESSPLTAGERLQLLVGLFFKADHAQEFVDRPWDDIGAIEIREVTAAGAAAICRDRSRSARRCRAVSAIRSHR